MEENEVGLSATDYIVYICGDITIPLAVAATQQMLQLDEINQVVANPRPIQFIINSGGGDLNAAWQIVDMMNEIQTPVHTTALGQVASGALMILMNGEPGERKATSKTSFMSHRFSWGADGNHANLIAMNKEFHSAHTRIMDHYIECTGLGKADILEKLLQEHDIWLDANEAKKLGIIDAVSNPKRTKPRKTRTARPRKTTGKK